MNSSLAVFTFIYSSANSFSWNWLITLFWYYTWSWVYKRLKSDRAWFLCEKSGLLDWVEKGTQKFLENRLFLWRETNVNERTKYPLSSCENQYLEKIVFSSSRLQSSQAMRLLLEYLVSQFNFWHIERHP